MVKDRCMDILHNEEDAQDLAQNIFENIYGKILGLKSEGQFQIEHPKTYLSTAARNMSINERNRAIAERKKIYDMATDGSFNRFMEKGEHEVLKAGIINNEYEQAEAEIIVKAILEEQDETTRKIYFYRYRDGMTLKQIGEVVGLGKSAVEKRIKKLEEQVRVKTGAGK
jgi:RNA polymerase sigma-70 factor (ECF subfamily)